MPVKAGKQVANTTPNPSGLAIVDVRLSPSGRISSGPDPSRKAPMTAARMPQTTHSTRTPWSAPLVSMRATRTARPGTLTHWRPRATSNLPPIHCRIG